MIELIDPACPSGGVLHHVHRRCPDCDWTETNRAGIDPTAIIDGDVRFGKNPQIGWYSIVRGHVRTGQNLRLGALSSIEGTVTIGDDVTIRGKCEIPNSIVGNRVNIYAGVKFYDTPNPMVGRNMPPIIGDDVTICCDAAILGGVVVGQGSFIGARVFLTESVPPNSFVTTVNEYKIRPLR